MIVVIGILAAISVVAYNGIQNRANDTVIKEDLKRFAKFIELKAADTGEYIAGGRVTVDEVNWTGNHWTFPGVQFEISKASYGPVLHNFSYCTGFHEDDGRRFFRVISQSKSGKYFEYNSLEGLKDRSETWIPIYGHNTNTLCADMAGTRSYSYGWNHTTTSWADWTI